jgi:hypothetical protein
MKWNNIININQLIRMMAYYTMVSSFIIGHYIDKYILNLDQPHTQTGELSVFLVQEINDKMDKLLKDPESFTEIISGKLKTIWCNVK